MSNAIRDGKGNSLSPEPCALIPLRITAALVVTERRREPVENLADQPYRAMRCEVIHDGRAA